MNDDLNKIKKAMDALKESPLRKALEEFKNSPMEQARKALERGVPSLTPVRYDSPEFRPPRIQTQKEVNAYQSAETLVKRLAETIKRWRAHLNEDQQPAIIAILTGGIQINVSSLAAESFNGVRIEGSLGGTPCVVVAHQSTVQMLCFVEPAEKPRRPIGFVIDGAEEKI